jgi:hypothetical protein
MNSAFYILRVCTTNSKFLCASEKTDILHRGSALGKRESIIFKGSLTGLNAKA